MLTLFAVPTPGFTGRLNGRVGFDVRGRRLTDPAGLNLRSANPVRIWFFGRRTGMPRVEAAAFAGCPTATPATGQPTRAARSG